MAPKKVVPKKVVPNPLDLLNRGLPKEVVVYAVSCPKCGWGVAAGQQIQHMKQEHGFTSQQLGAAPELPRPA